MEHSKLFAYRQRLNFNRVPVDFLLPFALSQPCEKCTDQLQLRHEYQNCLMQDKKGRITVLANAFPGRNLHDLAYRGVSEYTAVRKLGLRSQNAEMIIREPLH